MSSVTAKGSDLRVDTEGASAQFMNGDSLAVEKDFTETAGKRSDSLGIVYSGQNVANGPQKRFSSLIME